MLRRVLGSVVSVTHSSGAGALSPYRVKVGLPGRRTLQRLSSSDAQPRPTDRCGAATDMHIVTYNILSSHLASGSYGPFILRDPEALDPELRYERLLAKLEQQVARRAIICLQEVSRTWGARLHVYFRERGYTLLASHYDGAFSGYMGVAIAVPLDAYEMLDADVTRISDVKKWQREPPPSAVRKFLDAVAAVPAGALDGAWEGLLRAVPRNVKSSLISAAQKFRAARRDDREIATGKPFADPWPASRRRLNTAVSARVRDREGGARLAVTTYHMPCLFLQPQVMTIHAALAAQHARAFAGDDPHVLCGDFNFKPHEGLPPIPCYRLLTTGAIDERHEGYPTPPSWEPWRPVVEPLVSAYAEAAGEEPLFTNYVTFPDGSEFCETLDYIFHSGGDMACVGVLPTPETRHDCGPLPSVDEPSDHLMIGATLRVPVPTGQK